MHRCVPAHNRKILAAVLGLLNAGTASRRCVFYGSGMGRAKDPPALAWENDQ